MKHIFLILLACCFTALAQPATTVNTLADLQRRKPTTNSIETVYVRSAATNQVFPEPLAFRYEQTNALATNLFRLATGTGVGRWVHEWNGDATVFGADRTGVTDSATAINAALLYSFSNNIGRVYLPPGIYSVSTTIVVRPNTLLYGDFTTFTEDPSMVEGTANFKSGAAAWLKLADGANCPVVNLTTNGSRYVRQAGPIYDGGVRTAYYVNSGLRNIGIFGNQGGQTRNDCHGVISQDSWNLILDGVTIMKVKGWGIQWRNVNAARINKCNVVAPTNGRTVLLDDCADLTVSDNYFFGSDGPVVWINGRGGWKNQFVGNLLGNSYAPTAKQVTISGTNITTAAAHLYETGDMVMFENIGGTLPSQIQSNQTCMVIKIDATSFSISTNWADCEAGIAMPLSGGSGTNYVYRGRPSGFFISHGANRNSFTGNRVDQSFNENFYIQGGSFNSIVGNEISEAGTFGTPSVTTDLVAAIRLADQSQYNTIVGNIGASSDYTLTMSPDSTRNVYAFNSVYSTTAEFTNSSATLAANLLISSDGTWYLPSYINIGDYGVGTAMRMRGGLGAASLLTMDREGASKVGLNISGETLRILDETNQTVMASFADDSTTATIVVGGPGTPKTSRIYGGQPTGTDQAGMPLRLVVNGTGAGNASNANVQVFVPTVGSSGGSLQSVFQAFGINGLQSGKRTPMVLWDNEAGVLRQVTTTNLTVYHTNGTVLHSGKFLIFE